MSAARTKRLLRVLGPVALIIYGVGDILGAGIYTLLGKVAGESGKGAWLSFAVALTMAALTALSYAELAARYPKAGGEAHYAYRAFRREWLALLVGWLVLSTGVVSMATVTRAGAGYLVELAPWSPEWPVVILFLLLLAAVNLRGMRLSSLANITCTAVEVLGLFFVIAVSAFFLSGGGEPPGGEDIPVGPGGVLRGAALAFFAFIGFEDMVNVAEEVKSPRKALPVALLSAIAGAGAVYIAMALLATSTVHPADLARSKAPLVEVVRRAAPSLPAGWFSIVALFAVANTGLLNFITASRLLYGMAREDLVPRWIGAVHEGWHTPHRAIVLLFAVVLALSLSGGVAYLAGTTSFLILCVFISVNAALVVVRLREGAPSKGFRVPLVVPFVAISANAGLLAFIEIDAILTALGIVAVGAVLVVWRRLVRRG